MLYFPGKFSKTPGASIYYVPKVDRPQYGRQATQSPSKDASTWGNLGEGELNPSSITVEYYKQRRKYKRTSR